MVTIEQIKKLRNLTGVSIGECKKALEKANGDVEKAREILKEIGREFASKRLDRQTKAGIIDSYIHADKRVGVLLQLQCESDFVARSEDFKKLSHELCLQIAASVNESPLLEQPWIKEPKKTIKDLVDGYIAKFGENITIEKFVRYEI
jgi:elongation factor Ts